MSDVAFDPHDADNVHVGLKGGTGRTLFAATLTAASGLWSQPNRTAKKWIYKDVASPPTVGVKKAVLKESPAGSGAYQFKMIGKGTNIDGPLAPSDSLDLRIEIEPAGGTPLSLTMTLANCVNRGTKDICEP